MVLFIILSAGLQRIGCHFIVKHQAYDVVKSAARILWGTLMFWASACFAQKGSGLLSGIYSLKDSQVERAETDVLAETQESCCLSETNLDGLSAKGNFLCSASLLSQKDEWICATFFTGYFSLLKSIMSCERPLAQQTWILFDWAAEFF